MQRTCRDDRNQRWRVINVLSFFYDHQITLLTCWLRPISEFRDLLEKCAATAMSSKIIHSQKDFFKVMVVDAVNLLDEDLNERMIGMKKVPGGALEV